MTNFYSQVKQLGVLAVTGEKASAFLQGQTTCDMRQLTAEQGLRGACCNNKGRVLATFIVAAAPDGILLIMNASIIPSLMKHLQKYALLHHVMLENKTATHAVINYWSDDVQNKLEIVSLSFHLDTPTPNDYLVLPHDQISSFKQSITNRGEEISEDAWHCQRLRAHLPFIYPQTVGQFTPHQLGLPHSGFVSYEKGCYTGQEIIARMHFRGQDQVKQTLHLHEFPSLPTIEAGSLITLPDNQASGTLIDYAATATTNNFLGLILY